MSHQSSSQIIYHACDDSVMNLDNTEEGVYITYINSINKSNNRCMNYYANIYHKYYAPFFSSNKQEDVSTGT